MLLSVKFSRQVSPLILCGLRSFVLEFDLHCQMLRVQLVQAFPNKTWIWMGQTWSNILTYKEPIRP